MKLSLFLPPFFAAFLPYIACNFFDSPYPHGFFSGEVFLLLVLLALPGRLLLYKIPFVVMAILWGIWQGTEDAYAYAILWCILILVTTFLPRKRTVLSSFFGICVFLIFLIDSENFFDFTFSLHIRKIWNLASFYWWGPILFFFAPLIHLLLVMYFSRVWVWKNGRTNLSHKGAFILIATALLANAGIDCLQTRQTVMDFPVKKIFFHRLFLRHFEDKRNLDERTRQVFPIWNDSIDIVSDYSKPTVMILVESWGVNMNVPYAQILLSVFDSCERDFWGIRSRHAAHTQGAEWEDLGVAEDGKVGTITVPQRFRENGLQTYFLHGYNGEFYSREKTYAEYGFDTILFEDSLVKCGLSHCRYGFEGICDSSMIDLIDSLLSDSIPEFIYWTTLDAHPPYEFAEKFAPIPECRSMHLSDVECKYFTLQKKTLLHIAALARKHPDVRFVIHGDHRPIVSLKDRKFVNSFYSRWVSMVVLN